MRRIAVMMHAVIVYVVCLSALAGCGRREPTVPQTGAQQQITQQLRKEKAGE